MSGMLFFVVLLCVIAVASSYPDAVLPYRYGPPERVKNMYTNTPGSFLYELWQEIVSSGDMRFVTNPKDFLMKMMSLFVSRLFVNLQSITLNFLFML